MLAFNGILSVLSGILKLGGMIAGLVRDNKLRDAGRKEVELEEAKNLIKDLEADAKIEAVTHDESDLYDLLRERSERDGK